MYSTTGRVEKEKTVAYKRLAEYGTTLAPCLSRFSSPHGQNTYRFPYVLLRKIKQVLYLGIGDSIEWTSSIQNTMGEVVGLILAAGESLMVKVIKEE